MENIITIKKLREQMPEYVKRVQQGASFIVFKKSRPAFKISPIIDESWEEVVDFTKIKKGGVDINDILRRL